MNVVSFITEHRLVAIARKVETKDIVDTALALNKGGICLLEITFNQASPTCIKDTVASIIAVKKALGNKMCVGAGTVTTEAQAQAAAAAGADFSLAPNTDIAVISEMKRLGMVAVPGALTPSEILSAWNAGADIVKLFPAGNFGLSYVKAIRGPINHVPLMAVGGINEKNVKEFLDNGFCSCGIGSNIVRNDLIHEGKFEELTSLAKSFVQAIQ
ncbi:MAG: bifunctional 4-hydroxy-2-oxoglutarate aldolase/2-dehydro-3-deoxy-phosphogluconate aldolase [Sphaerochaetaceae bacterium]